MNVEKSQELQFESEIPVVKTLEDCVEFASKFTETYLHQIHISRSLAQDRIDEAKNTKGFHSSQQLTSDILSNFDEIFLSLCEKNKIDSIDAFLSVPDYITSFNKDLKILLVSEGKISEADSQNYTNGVFGAYLIFLLSPLKKVKDEVYNSLPPDNISELILLCNRISQTLFKDPSGCMASYNHRRWAIAYYTSLFVMAKKSKKS